MKYKSIVLFLLLSVLCVKVEAQMVRGHFVREPRPKTQYSSQILVIAGVGCHPSQFSANITAGYVKKWGWYCSINTDFSFNNKYEDTIDAPASLFSSGKTKNGIFSIRAGGILKVINPLMINLGVGYGTRWLNIESIGNIMYRLPNYSYNGFNCELGLIAQYRRYLLLLSIDTIDFKFLETNIGLGICF